MLFNQKNSQDHVSMARRLVSSLKKNPFPSRRHFAHLMHMLSPRELFVVRVLALVILANLVMLNTYAYRTTTSMVPSRGGTLREGILGSLHTTNPILATEKVDLEISKLIYASLFTYDPVDEEFVPELVESMTISEDQKTYTLLLRNNVTWHDGKPFNADDVLFTIQSILDPAYKSPIGASLKGMSAKKQDQYTIILNLDAPYVYIPALLTFGILPAHIFQQINPATFPLSDYNLHAVGSGPFIVENIRKDTLGNIRTIELKSNANFFLTHAAYIENMVIKLFSTREELMAALNEKSIDAAGFLPEASAPLPAQKSNHYQIFQTSFPQYTGLFFNDRNNQWLRYKELRQALMLAIPKQSITQQLYQEGEVTIIDTPILQGVPSSSGQEKDGNITEAKKIFAAWQEAMKPKPARATRKKPNTPPPTAPSPTLTLTTSSTPSQLAIAELIASAWNTLGITTTINTVESSKIKREIIKPRNYEVILFSLKTDGTKDPYLFWHSSQREWPGLNLSLFSDTKADALISEARTISDKEVRQKKYKELAEILTPEIPAIMLWNYRYTYMVSSSFKGIALEGLSSTQDRFSRVSEWYTKQKRSW